mmetsp:Transcript_27715/g.38935  ORF Transcript_27715/g.38935 Transcript_27715/m.38935 type:complete len:249 (-) Transcript_27715:91-837(-)
MALQVSEGRLGKRRDQPADEQGDTHDRSTDASGTSVIDGLEVLTEGELLVLGLQRVATPLVAGGGDDASGPDHKRKHEGILEEGLRLEHLSQGDTNEAAGPAIENVADDRGQVGLVKEGRLDLPSHALAEAVVGDRQHGGAEQEPTDGAAQASADGCERHGHVDDLENRELQHVGREGGQEEVSHELEIHLLQCLANRHSLDEKAIHQRLSHGGENGGHEGSGGTLSTGSEDLAKEVGGRGDSGGCHG